MDKKRAEHVLDSGVKILADVMPLHTYIYFPLLYSICVWAARRIFDLRERVFAWQVWIEPGAVETKPEAFVLNFYQGHIGLRGAYAAELEMRDMASLYKDFKSLYPVCGLEDAFLVALFRDELEAEDYRKIAAEFEARARKAVEDVKPASEIPDFWRGLQSMGMDMARLGIHMLSDAQVRKLIFDRIRKRIKTEEDE
jgi:hypothetical protein